MIYFFRKQIELEETIILVITKNKTDCWCKCFLIYLPKIVKNIETLSTFHPLPHDDAMPFPQSSSEATAVLVLSIHSRLGLEEPLDNPDMAVESCEVQRRRASGAAGGVRNLGHLKIGVPLKLALNLRNIVVLRCLEVIELVVLLKPCQPCRQSK